MRFLDRDHPYMYYVSKNNWMGRFKKWYFFSDIQYCIYVQHTGRLSQKSSKNVMTYYMNGPNLIVHSAKYIQGFTYVAYGRGRVAEDNKG